MSARRIRRTHEREADRRNRRVARRAALATGAVAATAALAAPGAQAANFSVTNLNNAGAGSLRGAVTSANALAGPDTISFTGAATSGEITLLTEIPITDDLTITGPGRGLSVSGDSDNDNVRDFATSNITLGDTRIFDISDPSSPGSPIQNVSISGITLKEGVADFFSGGSPEPEDGGAIYAVQTALTLTNVALTDNVSTQYGGAVFVSSDAPGSSGRLAVSNSTLSGNRALDAGGAIFASTEKYSSEGPVGPVRRKQPVDREHRRRDELRPLRVHGRSGRWRRVHEVRSGGDHRHDDLSQHRPDQQRREHPGRRRGSSSSTAEARSPRRRSQATPPETAVAAPRSAA